MGDILLPNEALFGGQVSVHWLETSSMRQAFFWFLQQQWSTINSHWPIAKNLSSWKHHTWMYSRTGAH